jgi:chromosome segregation ATPase
MKLDLNKIYICIIVVLLIGLIFQRISLINTTTKYDNKIENLTQKNDSLLADIAKTNTQISSLNSMISTYKSEIEQSKSQLDSLKILADKNKQKYNEARNRINALSNRAVVSEFTKTFGSR